MRSSWWGAGRIGQLGVKCAVVGGDQLPIGVATHPNRLFAQLGQPIQGLGGHRSGGYVAIEHDGVDSRRVDLIQSCVECSQIAVNVGQHRDPHQNPSRFRSTILAPLFRR
jgi:hypothetical protein